MKLLRNIRISRRLWILIALAFVGIGATTITALVESRATLMAEKSAQTRKLVEAAHSILTEYHRAAGTGEMAMEEARGAALKTLQAIRFDGGNYFWVNDMDANMVMHPLKPDLIGKNLAAFEDPAGKRLFSEFVAVVKRSGEGSVPYLWPKPGQEQPVEKVSYVKGFEPWGWLVGSGVYVDDVDATFWQGMITPALISLAVAALMLGGYLLISRSINLPLRNTVVALEAIATGDGDLHRRLEPDGRDEVSDLAQAFNRFADNIEQVVGKVKNGCGQLAGAVGDLNAVAESGRMQLEKQQLETQQVATAITEMVATVGEIARNAEGAASSASEADREAQAGMRAMKQTTGAIEALANEVAEAAEVINRLQSESDSIGSVLDVIRGIAEQTNLLALNAAIEAARAGEQGRGFAVVADEVRTLASRTQTSTSEIQQMIERLQEGSGQAVRVMQKGSSAAASTVVSANESAASLEQIVKSVNAISDMNTQIAAAAEEQSTVALEIDQSISRIAALADESSSTGRRVTDANGNLSQLGDELGTLVASFKVG
ncbi:MAG: methyl-accepting chemotaxis protein [Gammaproteobacteria bacterium]|nr:methyl-accepting chemotaxis protein [Gammaproteobacteria bacterium]